MQRIHIHIHIVWIYTYKYIQKKIVFNSRNIWFSFDEFQFLPLSFRHSLESLQLMKMGVASFFFFIYLFFFWKEMALRNLQKEDTHIYKHAKRLQYIILNRFFVIYFLKYWFFIFIETIVAWSKVFFDIACTRLMSLSFFTLFSSSTYSHRSIYIFR